MKEVVVALAAMCGCETREIPIACVLSALTPEERVREEVLLNEHLAATREISEVGTGYSFRYDPDPGLFARMTELAALERRCCPFLEFHMEWPRLRIDGGLRAKDFIRETFSKP